MKNSRATIFCFDLFTQTTNPNKMLQYYKLVSEVLRYNAKPLSLFGSRFEMCLNILGNKSNFGLFMKNLLRGNVVLPSKESSNFLSTVGHLDNRVDLDKNIKPGSNKYYAALCAMASKLAYENNKFIRATVEDHWKMELLGAYNFWDETYKAHTTQAFIFLDKTTNPNTIFVAFRGTEIFSAADWITDLDISRHPFPNAKGSVHSGFIKALCLKPNGPWPEDKNTGSNLNAYITLLQELKSHFEANQNATLVLTGHSLGGALAVLFSAVLAVKNETAVLERLKRVYTFGQPKVGDEKFGRFMEEKFDFYGVGYYRVVYNHDIVPRLPYDNSVSAFRHFGKCLYIDSVYEAKVVKEEPNYFSIVEIVRRTVDPFWELVRSFLLPRMFGEEYKEGLLLVMFRLVGLMFSGLPAHGPQDYINATRLVDWRFIDGVYMPSLA